MNRFEINKNYIYEMKGFLTDISVLIISLFEKGMNRLFSCSLLCFQGLF